MAIHNQSVRDLLAEIYATRTVSAIDGTRIPLHSEVTADEGQFISQLILDHRPKSTLEVGCAYGLSSLHVCDALTRVASAPHTIIDPFQSTEWGNIGVSNLRRAGLSNFSLVEQLSEISLPLLLAENRRFDFALIDGFHTFDQTLVDLYYVDRMLEVGGVLVIDDLQLPAVRLAVRYFVLRGGYRAIGGARLRLSKPSFKRRQVEGVFKAVASLLPNHFRAQVFSPSLFHDDLSLGLGYEMVGLIKEKRASQGTHDFTPF